MDAWWEALTNIQKLFWGIAIFSTVFFAIQTVLIFIGLGAEGDVDVDTDTDMDVDVDTDTDTDTDSESSFEESTNPLTRYFTVRNMVSFMMGFSWGGLGFIDLGFSTPLATVLAILVGLVFVGAMMLLMDILSKLKSEGTISLKNAVGQTASVTVQVPGNMEGYGKVGVNIQERFMEVEAVTKGDTLIRDRHVKVTGVTGNQLIVEDISKD